MPEMPTYWLNIHLAYACRHSGACCSSGWPIPIERERAATVASAIASGLVAPAASPWLQPAASAPEDVAGILALQPDGQCVWHQRPAAAPAGICTSSPPPARRACAVHAARPVSCMHFPYVCLVDARGVRVTLSHYCPTAASLLFEHEGPVEVVEGPSPVPGFDVPEGLDARESLPPLAAPNRLLSWDEFTEWEREHVRGCEGAGVRGCLGAEVELFDAARAAVPSPLSWPEAPVDFEAVWHQRVAPSWNLLATIVNRYLAAKAFASWAAYLGDGTAAVLRAVEQARAVLVVEAVRQCARHERVLGAGLLKQAIRQSDLLLVHYADRRGLISSAGRD